VSAPLSMRDEALPSRPQLRVRVLQPAEVRAVYLHMHGGGFAFGTPAMADAANERLAQALSLATVSVDYRLAPQHRHPAALEDCEAAALWLLEAAQSRFGCTRLLIGGDSVGATLAVLTLLRLRDRHGAAQRFAGANLTVGCYDFSMTPSQRQSSPELFLSPERLQATRTAAFPGIEGEALRVPDISPLYAALHGLPPALFTVGTCDAVLDDSLFMAARWLSAGNGAQLEVYAGGTHLFATEATPLAAEAHRRTLEFLRRCLEAA
jgi:acetyl esterase